MVKTEIVDLILAVTRWSLEVGLHDRDRLSPDPLDIKAILSKVDKNVLCAAICICAEAKMPEDFRRLLLLEWGKREGRIEDWHWKLEAEGYALKIEEKAPCELVPDVSPSGS
jgi:hypothetical protein